MILPVMAGEVEKLRSYFLLMLMVPINDSSLGIVRRETRGNIWLHVFLMAGNVGRAWIFYAQSTPLRVSMCGRIAGDRSFYLRYLMAVKASTCDFLKRR